jgi:hypothetical protein
MAGNTKTLPDIKGNETIAGTWRRLLERDRNASNLFSGDAFTEDQDPVVDLGRPNWRTDLKRLFIFDGQNFVNLFDYLTPEEIKYTIDHPNIPPEADNIKDVLDILVKRNTLDMVVLPAEGLIYAADGVTFEYNLARKESSKTTIMVFIDGVKQATNTFELSESGESIIFKVAPAKGETIEIIENSSLVEYDYSPVINTFTGDGSKTEFVTNFEILNAVCVNVNVDGKILQLSEYSLLGNGYGVKLNTAPVNGSKIQIITVNRTSFVTVSPASIGNLELKDGCVTSEKLSGSLPINMNSIPAGGITNSMIASESIDSIKIKPKSIVADRIADKTITKEKLSESVQNSLLDIKNVLNANLGDASVSMDKLGADVKSLLTNIVNRLEALEDK